jgi:hypothetical protein
MDKVQAKRISTIYNRSVQSKAEIREEGDAALQSFLRSGGSIQVVKPSRRKTGSKMTGKKSKGFQGGTSGFATGYPRRSLA